MPTCPMPNRKMLMRGEEVSDSETSWCRSVRGGLHYFSRMTRWDLAHSVSRIGQTGKVIKQGTLQQIEELAGYINGTMGHCLRGRRVEGIDKITTMTDSDHHGDQQLTNKSRTGVIVLLNGVPIHWRSNRQARSTLSPAESEIYALSTGVKDNRLIHWTLEEAGVAIVWPFTVQADNKAAISFQKDTCPTSKIRGCFDFREKWVKEMKDKDVVRTEHVETHKNLADIFTKCLDKKNYKFKYDMIVNYQDRM